MNTLTTHKSFILTGCLLWVLAFFWELSDIQPLSTWGLTISPVLTIAGIIMYYFKKQKKKSNDSPFGSEENSVRNSSSGIISYQKSLITVFVSLVIIWMIIILSIRIHFTTSGAFRAIEEQCKSDKQVEIYLGKVKYFGALFSGHVSESDINGEAEIYCTLIGEKRNSPTHFIVKKEDGKWKVTLLDLK